MNNGKALKWHYIIGILTFPFSILLTVYSEKLPEMANCIIAISGVIIAGVAYAVMGYKYCTDIVESPIPWKLLLLVCSALCAYIIFSKVLFLKVIFILSCGGYFVFYAATDFLWTYFGWTEIFLTPAHAYILIPTLFSMIGFFIGARSKKKECEEAAKVSEFSNIYEFSDKVDNYLKKKRK